MAILTGSGSKSAAWHFIPAERWLLPAEPIGSVRIWDAATGRPIREFHAAASRVNAIAFSPDGTRIATGSLEHTVNVWDAATGRLIAVFAGHAAPVFHVAFSADGTRLVSASQDATVKLWDLASEPGVRRFQLARGNGTVDSRPLDAAIGLGRRRGVSSFGQRDRGGRHESHNRDLGHADRPDASESFATAGERRSPSPTISKARAWRLPEPIATSGSGTLLRAAAAACSPTFARDSPVSPSALTARCWPRGEDLRRR